MDRGSSDIELMARGLRVQLQQSAGNLVRHDVVSACVVVDSCSPFESVGTTDMDGMPIYSAVDDGVVGEVEGVLPQHSGSCSEASAQFNLGTHSTQGVGRR